MGSEQKVIVCPCERNAVARGNLSLAVRFHELLTPCEVRVAALHCVALAITTNILIIYLFSNA